MSGPAGTGSGWRELCGKILGLAASLAADPPRARVGVDVETQGAVASPFARTLLE